MKPKLPGFYLFASGCFILEPSVSYSVRVTETRNYDFEPSNAGNPPEVALYLAIIDRAIRDAEEQTSEASDYDQQEAIRWLRKKSRMFGSFLYYADLIELEDGKVEELIERANNARLKRQAKETL